MMIVVAVVVGMPVMGSRGMGLRAMGAAVMFSSEQLGIGWVKGSPGSGYFPFWIGTIMSVASVAIVKTSNRLRQPIQFSSQSVGAVAVTAPSEPSMIIPPLTNATCSLGNQTTIALSPAINEAATPSPIMARPTRSSTKLLALPNSVAPPTAITNNTLWTSRGP